MFGNLRWMMAKKTVFSLVDLQVGSERLQRVRWRELVAWCQLPPRFAGSGSSESVSSRRQGASSGSVRLVVVRPLPRSFAKVRPRGPPWAEERS